MDDQLRLIYRETFQLDNWTPREVRARIGGFSPLFGDLTAILKLAASVVATAFAREREPDSAIDLQLFGVDERFRIEFSNSLAEDYLLAATGKGHLSRKLLDELTDRWGVVGNGAAVVWFEKGQPPFSRQSG